MLPSLDESRKVILADQKYAVIELATLHEFGFPPIKSQIL
jgi:hypothetical protein